MNKTLLYKRQKNNNYENGVCLNMIIKNESKNMPRLFENLHKYIKYFVICDTGSTDNTVKVIEEVAEKYNIDGEVYTEPFKNFGYNRSYSYNLTLETEANFKYVLFLKIVNLYNPKILDNITTIANLATGAYGLYNSGESKKQLPPNTERWLIYHGINKDKIGLIPNIILKKYRHLKILSIQ